MFHLVTQLQASSVCSSSTGQCCNSMLPYMAHRYDSNAVLSSVAPPSLRCTAATDSVLQTIEAHPNWPVDADVFEHLPSRLASRRPIRSDMTQLRSGERTCRRLLWSATLLLPALLSDNQVSISLVMHRETRCRGHSIDIAAEQAALVWACAAKR